MGVASFSSAKRSQTCAIWTNAARDFSSCMTRHISKQVCAKRRQSPEFAIYILSNCAEHCATPDLSYEPLQQKSGLPFIIENAIRSDVRYPSSSAGIYDFRLLERT